MALPSRREAVRFLAPDLARVDRRHAELASAALNDVGEVANVRKPWFLPLAPFRRR